jgi:hypothetical protein
MCQWKFFVLRYNANTSESSGINACEMARAASSGSAVGVEGVGMCNMSVTSLIVVRVPLNEKHQSQLRFVHHIGYKSFPVSRPSIK